MNIRNTAVVDESHHARYRVMKFAAALFALLALAACSKVQRIIDAMTGKTTNIIVLADQPLMIGATQIVLPAADARVVGKDTSVCFLLRGNVPSKQMMKLGDELDAVVQDAGVSVSILSNTGQRTALLSHGQAWSMYGVILPEDELSICFSVRCGTASLPIGTEVVDVTLSATNPLQVFGVYWQSTDTFDQLK